VVELLSYHKVLKLRHIPSLFYKIVDFHKNIFFFESPTATLFVSLTFGGPGLLVQHSEAQLPSVRNWIGLD
jgi:hypothetical protein